MRLAVDTNVLARAMIDDGSEQARRSRQCFLDYEVFVPDTVLLETEWLLRSRLKISREAINTLFSRLISSSTVFFEDRIKIGTAVTAHAKGLDFADALHLLTSKNCASMVTFDEDFIKRHTAVEDAMPVHQPQ
jgi:predicted nucleic-acid-binding protein